MQNIKVAIVGAGSMALEHARAFAGLPDVTLVGIHSKTRSKAEQLAAKYPGMQVCDSIADLYAETKADLVVVTVSIMSMSSVANACFEFPWMVLLEKPAGYDLNDAASIRSAAQQAGGSVFVALNRRGYSSTRQATECLNKQDNHHTRFVNVLDQQDMSAARDIYGHPKYVVKNYMYANSIHLIDYFYVLCRGEVERVERVIPWMPEKPGIVVAKIMFSSGDVGLYQGNWMGPGPWAVTVATAMQRIEMRPLEQITVQLRGERKTALLPTDQIDDDFKPGFRYQAQQAVDAVRGNSSKLPTLEESWDSMELVHKIYSI